MAQPTVVAGPITSPVNGHQYYLLNSDTWTNSEAKARTLGGHLATIRNAAEDAWMFNTFGLYARGINNGLWLGGILPSPGAGLSWISGEPVSYTRWSPNEPNGNLGPEYVGKPQYLQVFGPDDGRTQGWNDQLDVNIYLIYGVVEVLPVVPVTINTSPPGLAFAVDGVAYASTQTFNWISGSTHAVSVAPQQSFGGTRSSFTSWSDGGAATHTVTVSASPTTITAAFTTSFLLTPIAMPASGGMVIASPASPDGFYLAGANVQLSVSQATGYVFQAWLGDLTGSSNPQTLVMNAPKTVTANLSCAYTLLAQSAMFEAIGGVGSVNVSAGAGCAWNTTGVPSWITISSAPAGSGNGVLIYNVQANTSTSSRSVLLTVAGRTFTVAQAAATPAACAYSISASNTNLPATGGLVSVDVGSDPFNCSWTAISSSSWAIVTGGNNGSGPGTVTLNIVGNPSAQSRTSVVTIAGYPFTVTQAATIAAGPPLGLRFVSLNPCRVMETRPEYNAPVRTGTFGPPYLRTGETRTLNLPASNVCFIPAAAKAYVVNVTAVPRSSVDFITVFPAGDSRPQYRTVSSPDGQTVANSAIVKAGSAGGISVYTTGDADVLIDITGYFTDDIALSNLVFYPVAPCRVIETRSIYQDALTAGTVFGRVQMNDRETRTYPIRSSQKCGQGIPNTVAAYAVTLTVVPPGPLAFVTAWPTGQAQPGVSSINSFAGRTLANSVILPAGTDGSIDVFAFNKTDLLMDITGYFAPDNGAGLLYSPVTQCRAADSTLYGNQTTRTIALPSSPSCSGISANAKGYALNVTALPNGNPMPFITAYPTGQLRPGASILNAFEGQTVTNSAITPAGTGGAVDIFTFQRTEVIVEVSGYFGR